MGILADWQIQRDVGITPFEVYDRDKQRGKISYGLSGYGYDARCGYKFKVFDVIAGGTIDPKNFDPAMLREIDLTPKHVWEVVTGAEAINATNCTSAYRCGKCRKWAAIRSEDPKPGDCVPTPDTFILIPPHSFVLAETLEEFTIPRDVLCVVLGKSTYARCGLIVNVTPGEPEWTGKWTVELSNTTPLPLKVYAGEGVMQCCFFRSDGLREAVGQAVVGLTDTDIDVSEVYARLMKDLAGGVCRESYATKRGKYQNQPGLTIPKVTE